MTRRPSARATRRRAREAVWTLILVAGIVAASIAVIHWRDGRDRRPAANPAPSAEPGPSTSTGMPAGVPGNAQRIRIAFTRDGDTLEANAVSVGTPIGTTDRIVVRLLGIDAPETHGASGQPQCYSRDAYKELQRLTPNGTTAWVVADKQVYDPYQRYLLYVWNDRGLFVNLELARLGYVRMLSIAPNLAHQPDIDAAVDAAEKQRIGLWGRCVSATPK
ncbi:MAG TPA: thermonuclease family protein [Micromonosporaceae bacterium]